MRLENQPAHDEKTGIDRATVVGDVPVGAMKPDWTPESMPDYFQLMTGTFFEIGAVYLLASGSLGHLRKLQGGTAQIDRRRFLAGRRAQHRWSGKGRGFPAYGVVRDFNARPTRSPARLEYTSDHRTASSGLPRGLCDRDQVRVAPGRRCGIPCESRDAYSVFRVGLIRWASHSSTQPKCKNPASSTSLVHAGMALFISGLPHWRSRRNGAPLSGIGVLRFPASASYKSA